MLHNKYFKWTFAALCLLAFVSCSDDSASSPAEETINVSQFQVGQYGELLTECSGFTSRMGSIPAQMKVYKYNNQTHYEKMSLRFLSNIDLNNKTLVFYRWRQDSNGSYSPDNQPLTFDVTINGSISTGYTNLTNPSNSGINLTQINFTIHNLEMSYHALQIAIYDQNNQIISYADGLLPLYAAHPAEYNRLHPNQNLLKDLHPYKNEANSSASQASFAQRAHNDFCF